MSNEYVEVLNLETGARGRIRRRLFENPAFNNGILEEVEATQKPYAPELYKSKVEPETPPLLDELVEDEIEEEDA